MTNPPGHVNSVLTYAVSLIYGAFMDNARSFGARVAEFRNKQGLSQKDMADRLDYGQPYQSAIEIGRALPSRQYVESLVNAFDMNNSQARQWWRAAAQASGWDV